MGGAPAPHGSQGHAHRCAGGDTGNLSGLWVVDFVQETRNETELGLLRGRSADAGLSGGAKN
jgi:hypothetical protein